MEENKILEILKKVPLGTELYSPVFGEMIFNGICDAFANEQRISMLKESEIDASFYTDGKYRKSGEVMLFPSDKMRNWDKFAWEKGDVLVNSKGKFCIFKEFSSYPYTTFIAVFTNNIDIIDPIPRIEVTQEWNKASSEKATKYIEYVKANLEKVNKRLNLETLEIESQKFNDGDILTCLSTSICNNSTFILRGDDIYGYLYYAATVDSGELYISTGNTWCGKNSIVRHATEEEKTKLFDVLGKEGKRWNAEEKVIEDIKQKPKKECATYKKVYDKPEHEFQPFERVLVRDSPNGEWIPSIFGHKTKNIHFSYACLGSSWEYCIPYEGNEHLLGTRDDPED